MRRGGTYLMRRCGVEGDHREHFNLSHCKVLTAGKGQLPMARFVLFTDKFDDNRRGRGEREMTREE